MQSFQELREKTLTPAEKKKREEIAKAIERDDPGMDMSKKMAIATAQAKKVAEGKGFPAGWMLKADPKLGAKVKATQDKQKAMHKIMGNPNAGKKKESVAEEVDLDETPKVDQRLSGKQKVAARAERGDNSRGFNIGNTTGGTWRGKDAHSPYKDSGVAKSGERKGLLKKDAIAKTKDAIKSRLNKEEIELDETQGVAEGSEQYYAIVHKVNKKPLSTHRDLESAKDEWRGLDQNQRQFYKVVTTKKAPKDWSMKSEELGEAADGTAHKAPKHLDKWHKAHADEPDMTYKVTKTHVHFDNSGYDQAFSHKQIHKMDNGGKVHGFTRDHDSDLADDHTHVYSSDEETHAIKAKHKIHPDTFAKKKPATVQGATKESVDEVSDTTLKNYNKGAMRDTMMGKKDRNAGMQQATKRLAGLNKPLMKEGTVAETQYKIVGGKKMRWDDMKKMWTPVRDLFHMEQDKKEPPPFDGPFKKVKSVIPGKQGEGPSTAKHLAKLGLKAFLKAKK